METCCLCENKHAHPRGFKATQERWSVFEIDIEIQGLKKKAILVFCPKHPKETVWDKVKKEFPPTKRVG